MVWSKDSLTTLDFWSERQSDKSTPMFQLVFEDDQRCLETL